MDDTARPVVDDIKVQRKMASSFGRLPDDIILLILQLCDPDCFASLVLLNRNWRRVSEQAPLYARQLSKCRSYAAAHHNIDTQTANDQLPLLRMLFAREVKRNLFEAYLRPRQTIVNLVSTSISSSSAFPGGEAFHFSFSPNGQFILACSTSRIHVIHAGGGELSVKRELKILRRPASVTILDDGSLLAVLSTDHQVDLYDLTKEQAQHIRAIALDHPPRTIALDAAGSVLAAAYDGGVEVYSLASTALPTDRRGVKCDAADSLSFSADGTQLLGTTSHSKNPSTVILTAPYFNPGEHTPEDSISQLWTTSILFPNSSRDCSHAVLLPCPMNEDTSWTFTYDRVFETFRAVRIDDLRNGTTYFTGPISKEAAITKLLPSTLPAATGTGDMVAAGFQGKEIWIYGVPEDLEAVPETTYSVHQTWDGETGSSPTALSRANSGPSPRSHTWPRDSSTSRMPQWKLLCDKSRNTFVEGRQIGSLDGVSSLKWVSADTGSFLGERLIGAAPGGVSQPNGMLFEGDNEGAGPVDGGRLCILDFNYGVSDGEKTVLTIEVGEREPETLEEEHRDLEAEVAIVRRRTVAQRQGGRTAIQRAATIAARLNPGVSQSLTDSTPSVPPISMNLRSPLSPMAELSDVATIDEDQESLDAPYSHGSPRSRVTLNRAATAAAVNRRLHPRLIAGQEHITFRRADGREEHPHESDADNWVPPPPPYTKDAVPPLPEHLRNAIAAGVVTTTTTNLHRSATQRSSGSAETDILSTLHRSRTTFARSGSNRSARADTQQRLSISTSISSNDGSPEPTRVPPVLAPVPIFEDIYDVSPPRTPELAEPVAVTPPTPVAVTAYQIPRRPVPSSGFAEAPPLVIRGSSLTEPESPVPQHQILSPTGRPISEIAAEWDSTGDEGRVSPMEETVIYTSSEPSAMAPNNVNTAIIPGANGYYPVTAPPITSWADGPGSRVEPRVDPTSTSRNLTTAPIQPSALSSGQLSNDLDMPSPAQLARLNSRSGRPASRVIVDPSRRRSGSFTPPQSPVGGQGQFRNGQHAPPNIYVPDPRTFAAPRAASGSYGSPMLSPIIDSPVHSRSSHLSEGAGRPPSNTGSSRPRAVRLETIHSVASQGETAQPPYAPAMAQMRPAVLSRQPSRAERSAALNMQQAKRNGWRGSMRRKNKVRDGASSTGWTNVPRDSIPKEKKQSKGSRCVVM